MMDFYLWLEAHALSTWVREAPTIWAYATILTLHTLGMGALVGTSTVLNLRVLGVGRTIPIVPLRVLFRVVWIGFWVNLATGVLLFGADASTRGTQGLFFAKLLFVAVGVGTVVLIERHVYSSNSGEVVVSSGAKSLAFLSLLAWVAAITSGRLLAYVR